MKLGHRIQTQNTAKAVLRIISKVLNTHIRKEMLKTNDLNIHLVKLEKE